MKKSLLAALSLALVPMGAAMPAHADDDSPTASVVTPPEQQPGGQINSHFVGLSIEWSLIERYMGPAARPAFTNLLRNLDGGILRIGGSSQDQTPFSATAPNANDVITPEDVADVRATLDGTRTPGATGWATVLGTAMAPASTKYPFRSPEHSRAFVEQGVEPAFAGADDEVAGIELGNEPDLGYHYDVDSYLGDFARWRDAGGTTPYTTIVPATSNAIAPWQAIADQSVETRFFHDWPQILDTTAPTQRATAGPLGAWTADHFYPLARTCTSDPYRCPSIPALLEPERTENLDYIAYHHAVESRAHGLGYRLEEINSAAGRGADGVSNVAASAIWGLDTMFHVACPQPPDDPGANSKCRTTGNGVNFHNAEVRAFYFPEEGNGYYNAIRYDTSDAMGAPTPAPLYYAMLMFAGFAQGHDGLRPVAVDGAGDVSGWRVNGSAGESRLFLINRSQEARDVDVTAPGVRYLLDRMSPYDATGAGRTLDAPDVRIDGRSVAPDGSWPGFAPESGAVHDGHVEVHLGEGEAVVLRVLPAP
ncbi:MAG TPA: hypothetical protein VFE07_01625 [Marmoricola sp.]|nr:hypothetical protein [Marmoricola sp.]